MAAPDFRVPLVLDYVAVVAWVLSGAVVGIRKQFDVTGVFVIALLSSTGGGLMRDAFLLQRTPIILTNPVYLLLIALVTTLVTLFTKQFMRLLSAQTSKKAVDLIDAIGIPAFAVVGMELALDRGIPTIGVVFVGVVNGVGGGLLRDVVVREVPSLLRPGQFVTLFLLLACGMFLILTLRYGMSPPPAAWTTVAVFFVLRLLAVRFNWKTRSVIGGSDNPPATPRRVSP